MNMTYNLRDIIVYYSVSCDIIILGILCVLGFVTVAYYKVDFILKTIFLFVIHPYNYKAIHMRNILYKASVNVLAKELAKLL